MSSFLGGGFVLPFLRGGGMSTCFRGDRGSSMFLVAGALVVFLCLRSSSFYPCLDCGKGSDVLVITKTLGQAS